MIRITIFLEYYIDGKCRNNFFLKARSVNEVQYKKRKTSKDLDYSNSSRVFRPLASRTCLSNVRTESREE